MGACSSAQKGRSFMADRDDPSQSVEGEPEERPERIRPLPTRRDFLIGAGTGAVAVGVVAGAGFAASQARPATQPVAPTGPGAAVLAPPLAQPAQPAGQQAIPAKAPPQTLPPTMRHVTLNIDGIPREATVDVRESLWETMVNQFGLAGANLGCDRAQCGACTVTVDGRAVNGCTVLSARLGRGQQILTVNGLTRGPGPEGLHPIQRAYWQEGGFQCGICTRGLIMSTYALLQTNPKPTDDQIAEGLAGNICRCGEYTKIFTSVKLAAAEMRGEPVTYTAPYTQVVPSSEFAPPPAVAITGSKTFEFVTALPTIEEFEPFADKIRRKKGIVEVSGSERTIVISWGQPLNEDAVRRLLADNGRPVK
jgi:aerobic-type carbon monoxide dehydrogenase small subunit (CoxS/CutS family)